MYRNTSTVVGVLAGSLLLSACGSGDSSAPSSPAASGATSSAPSTTAASTSPKASSTTKIVAITEDNDPNNLIGRPNGYVSAAVIYDSNATCTDIGVDCGATVEVWQDEASAKTRSEYIQSILKASPILGSEFHTLDGPVLLRVDGKQLKPSLAKKYAAALTG